MRLMSLEFGFGTECLQVKLWGLGLFLVVVSLLAKFNEEDSPDRPGEYFSKELRTQPPFRLEFLWMWMWPLFLLPLYPFLNIAGLRSFTGCGIPPELHKSSLGGRLMR